MRWHIFNSSVVSGPETLTIPALNSLGQSLNTSVAVVLILEERLRSKCELVQKYVESFNLKCFTIWVKGRIDLTAIDTFSSLINSHQPNIVHAHDVKASFYALKASQRLSKELLPKLVSTHHGTLARK